MVTHRVLKSRNVEVVQDVNRAASAGHCGRFV
jgi:hypothetical protein